MIRFFLIFLCFVLLACGGSLTEEQRRKMQKGRELQSIVKVTEAEIMEAAFAKGRSVIGELSSPSLADQVAKTSGVKIHWLEPGEGNAIAIEQQLIDAYINSVIEGVPLQDNVQDTGADSMLYTKPVVVTNPDSSIIVKGTWNIWMSKKQLILGMGK
ncbi:MAG: hypothetical protein WAZ98_11785 [Cyclobacteriaceae bacterium]